MTLLILFLSTAVAATPASYSLYVDETAESHCGESSGSDRWRALVRATIESNNVEIFLRARGESRITGAKGGPAEKEDAFVQLTWKGTLVGQTLTLMPPAGEVLEQRRVAGTVFQPTRYTPKHGATVHCRVTEAMFRCQKAPGSPQTGSLPHYLFDGGELNFAAGPGVVYYRVTQSGAILGKEAALPAKKPLRKTIPQFIEEQRAMLKGDAAERAKDAARHLAVLAPKTLAAVASDNNNKRVRRRCAEGLAWSRPRNSIKTTTEAE